MTLPFLTSNVTLSLWSLRNIPQNGIPSTIFLILRATVLMTVFLRTPTPSNMIVWVDDAIRINKVPAGSGVFHGLLVSVHPVNWHLLGILLAESILC